MKRVATRSRSRSPSRSRSLTRGDKKHRGESNGHYEKDKLSDKEKKRSFIEGYDERKVIENGSISSNLTISVANVSLPFRDKIKLALGNEPLSKPIATQALPQVAFRDRIQLALDSLK